MSYRVEYAHCMKDKCMAATERKGSGAMVIFFFLIFLGSVCFLWEEGKSVLFQLLLPGDAAKTWNSILTFAMDLNQGIPLEHAAREFCYEVLGTIH